MRYTITTKESFTKKLEKVSRKLTADTIPFRESGKSLVKSMERNILNQGGDFYEQSFDNSVFKYKREQNKASGKFAKLRPFTMTLRRLQGYKPAYPILIRTGSLMRSFYWQYGKNGVTIKNRASYASDTHYGDRKENRVARPIIGLTPEALKDIYDSFSKYLKNAVK